MDYYVYILTNYSNSVLYIGITNNLERRIDEHKRRIVNDSFTKRYKLYKLLWFESFSNPIDAIATEKKIKGWKRERKLALIKETNTVFRDLSKTD